MKKNGRDNLINEYKLWTLKVQENYLKDDLSEIEGDDEKIYNRFCRDMTFGTSGLRNLMEAGPNRINPPVIARATLGLSRYLKDNFDSPSCIIAYDTRLHSRELAETALKVLSANQIKAQIFSEPTPVPVLSFAIRHLGVSSGIMITASHNPREYNGYKVYDRHGNQIEEKTAAELERYIGACGYFEDVSCDSGTSDPAGHDSFSGSVKDAYMTALAETLEKANLRHRGQMADRLKICYTPLHGAGRDYVLPVLKALGFSEPVTVDAQMVHDGAFPTCPKPNPENEESFSEALKACYMEREEGRSLPDIILATDPDSDRLGVCSLENGQYVRLTGDEVGVLLLDFIIRRRTVSFESGADSDGKSNSDIYSGSAHLSGKSFGHPVAFKSYVSTPLAERIAAASGVEMRNVFTGFKNIAFGIEKLKQEGREEDFIFGYEESIGYLTGNYTRDKDGILAAAMVALLAEELKERGLTLQERLAEIYEEFGFLRSRSDSVKFDSEREREKINRIMDNLFKGKLRADFKAAGYAVKKETCFRENKMYMADLEGGHRVILRPSGTELRLKMYVFAEGRDAADMNARADGILNLVRTFCESSGGRNY